MPQIVPGAMPVSGDPPMMAAQYGYAQLLHGQGSRKNATRESTQQLKVWLKEHQKNPYPTKGEKIMLALMSGKKKKVIFFIKNSFHSTFISGNTVCKKKFEKFSETFLS